MTITDKVNNEYFEWMYNLMCGDRHAPGISYRKLLMQLHDIEFVYFVHGDQNRAEDGIYLRHRFSIAENYYDAYEYLEGPCSVLEMMVALANRCETDIMDNTEMGDRTAQWFWDMIVNLGLGAMDDNRHDKYYVERAIEKLLNREYSPDGRGGLFTVENYARDMRDVEIWVQLLWYLDNIV